MPKFKIAYALITPTAGGTHRDTETVDAEDRRQAVLALVDGLEGELRAETIWNYWVVDVDGSKIYGWKPEDEDDLGWGR